MLAAESHDHPHHTAQHRGGDRPRLVVHDEDAARRRQLGEVAHRLGHGIRGQVGHDALPHPGRLQRGVEARCLEGRCERVVLEVDGDRHDLSGGGLDAAEAALLVALGRRVVDLEDGGARELRHAPGAGVEAGADHDDLRGAVLAHGVVDGDGARNHEHRRAPHQLVGHPAGTALWRVLGAGLLDDGAFVGVEEVLGDRVGEAADGEAPVRHGPSLADEHRGAAGGSIGHPSILARRREVSGTTHTLLSVCT